jgi:DNA invertase Pin-like site-specific DNA recombinase
LTLGKRVGYKRVSTVLQNTDRQLHGMDFDKIFIDRVSGKDTQRPKLQEMLSWIREGDHIYVHSMDRLARNSKDMLTLVDYILAKGAEITFVKENLTFADKNSPMARLQLNMIAAFAEFECDIILERQREGIALAKQKSKYKGRKSVFNDEDAALIREKKEAGVPIARIAKEMKVSRATIYKYLATWGGKMPCEKLSDLTP